MRYRLIAPADFWVLRGGDLVHCRLTSDNIVVDNVHIPEFAQGLFAQRVVEVKIRGETGYLDRRRLDPPLPE